MKASSKKSKRLCSEFKSDSRSRIELKDSGVWSAKTEKPDLPEPMANLPRKAKGEQMQDVDRS